MQAKKKPAEETRRADFLIERVPIDRCQLASRTSNNSAETLGPLPRPNLKGPRVTPRVGSFLTAAAKVAAAVTRARVDLRISASLSSAVFARAHQQLLSHRKSYRFQLDFIVVIGQQGGVCEREPDPETRPCPGGKIGCCHAPAMVFRDQAHDVEAEPEMRPTVTAASQPHLQ